MKEFFESLLRWFLFGLFFCFVYMALTLAAGFAEELAPISAQKFTYYLLGMFTFAFVERISEK